ncbi:MAG: CoB--CoM heterodisulfide reductase iron-sulfur subunit A family protein [Thermoplasmata archaeon]
MPRIGVFVCHCGINIAGVVDVEKVVEEISKYPDVVHAEHYKYMCSDPGQNLIVNAIREKRLDGVVVAACSPNMHETTFRNACERAGLNKYRCEMANIREQSSWVHADEPERATEKAIQILQVAVEKVKLNAELKEVAVPVTKRCLVIGGGVAGIQAALDVADAGYEVILVEKTPSIGGHMAQLSETFPTLDCSQCILTPKMVAVARHPNIKLLTYAEVVDVKGFVGNFRVKIHQKARYVTKDCNICGKCEEVCPVIVPNEFDRNLSPRKAIYLPFPQAVPARYTIDTNHCLGLNPLVCGKCKEVCEARAIDYDMQDEEIEVDVGAIIVATGYELFPKEKIGEYGYGIYPDVIDGLEFERLLSASGPTGGEVVRPSDGKIPKVVAFIQCTASRDPDSYMPYCSKICCMYTAKHAMLYKHHVHDGKAYVFYIDIRAGGKDYEEFVKRAMEEERITYIRGKVSKVFKRGDKMVVWGSDTLSGEFVELEADLVVLASAIVPAPDTKKVANLLKIPVDENSFLKEAHPKLRPVETLVQGVYICGAAHGPKDIPETVAQASGAASKAIAILSGKELYHEPTTAEVNMDACSGCRVCVNLCPFSAITFNETTHTVEINEILCEGCGTCVAACPTGALKLRNMTDRQIFNMIRAALSGGD